MQKKIIALAIAAAFSAPAFADTTVYGVVDATVASLSGAGQKSDMLAFSGGLAGSRLGVKSVQDAGDMKVVAVVEYALDTQLSDGIGAARQEMLAVAGGFGTVATGYLQTTGYDWAVKFDPTSGSLVSPLQSMTMNNNLIGSKTAAARAPRALAYISPDLGGVTVAVNYTTSLDNTYGNLTQGNADTTTVPASQTCGVVDVGGVATPVCSAVTPASTVPTQRKTTAYLLSATYTGGPLSVGGVYAATASTTTGYDAASEMALGASYDLTVVKLFATYQTMKISNVSGNSKAMSFGVVAPVGPGAIAASYAKNSINLGGATGENGSGLTVAYLQGLSKTATVYAAVSKVSQDSTTNQYSVANNVLSAATLENGGGSTLFAVGLNNKF